MEQSIEQFRKDLITKNPDVADKDAITLSDAINNAYQAMDLLTDLLLVEMEHTSCIECAKILSSSFGEMRIAFNAVSDLKEADSMFNEGHN